MLRGRFHDPLIGRDILVGGILGAGVTALDSLTDYIPTWLGQPPARPRGFNFTLLHGPSWTAGTVLDSMVHALLQLMSAFFVLLLLRIVLRKQWLAAGAFVLLFVAITSSGTDDPWMALPVGVVIITIFTIVLVRYGLVAATAGFYFILILQECPLTVDLSAWYAQGFIVPLLVVVALLIYGFHTALAGQPVFGSGRLLDE
jgi:hypothetical protein